MLNLSQHLLSKPYASEMKPQTTSVLFYIKRQCIIKIPLQCIPRNCFTDSISFMGNIFPLYPHFWKTEYVPKRSEFSLIIHGMDFTFLWMLGRLFVLMSRTHSYSVNERPLLWRSLMCFHHPEYIRAKDTSWETHCQGMLWPCGYCRVCLQILDRSSSTPRV